MDWKSFLSELWEFTLYFLSLALMWVGAEYVFEGQVHSSGVDTFMCALLARVLQREDNPT